MPTMTIDGQEITVDRGTTVLQAATQLGIDIPTFCYHPGLTIVANCRMCLVDTNKSPKPLPACHATAMDGMEVWTQNEKVQKVRKSVLEFILVNHPVDCPICDQAGECVLQDHYFNFSAQPSRLFHRKQHKPKAKVLGPDIMLDAERCILCTRCVRFCDEIAKTPQLTVVNRGEHSEITTFPGEELDNPYAINVVDICPVGALTSRDFRFQTRVWFLQTGRSVCPECSKGCTIRVDTFEGVPRRYKPAHNPQVNDWWMCDTGRLSYSDYLDNRMEGPTTTVDGKRRVADTESAVRGAVEILRKEGAGKVVVVVSPWFTNEDAYLTARLLKGPLSGAAVYMGGRPDGVQDDILIEADKNPNRRGVAEIFNAVGVSYAPLSELSTAGKTTALIFGDNHGLSDAQRDLLGGLDHRIVVGAFMTPLWRQATVFLPARIHWEKDGSFTNVDGVVQRLERVVKAAATAKSDGWYSMKMGYALGGGYRFDTPGAVFDALCHDVPGFAGMSYSRLGDHGMVLGSGEPPLVPSPDVATDGPALEAAP